MLSREFLKMLIFLENLTSVRKLNISSKHLKPDLINGRTSHSDMIGKPIYPREELR
jgi:hypothetical protein